MSEQGAGVFPSRFTFGLTVSLFIFTFMANPGNKAIKATLLGVAGLLFLSFPLLSMADKHGFVWGIPVLYLYVFIVWALIILALLFLSGNRNRPRKS